MIKTDGEASTGDSETTTEQHDVSAQGPDRPESESTQQQQEAGMSHFYPSLDLLEDSIPLAVDVL